MSESDNIRSYSAADIQQYLRGELSPSEMHAMEKAAMDDPFLADAIEGMESTRNEYGDEIINSNLAELNSAIAEKSESRRVVAMKPSILWYAAAAVVIVIGGIFTYSNFKNNSEPLTIIAKGENAKPPAQPEIGPADETTTISPYKSGTLTIQENDRRSKNDSTSSKSRLSATPEKDAFATYLSSEQESLVTPSAPQLTKDTQNLTFYNSRSDVTSLPPVQLRFDTAKANGKMEKISGRVSGVDVADRSFNRVAANKEEDKIKAGGISDNYAKAQVSPQEEFLRNQNRLNNIRGRVLDNNSNLPVANAIVAIDKEKYTTVTNDQGYFYFNNVRDSVANASVSVVGYDQKKVELNTAKFSDIRIDPSSQSLNEVVVVGYGSQKKKALPERKELSPKVQDATPVIDWIQYEKYLQNSKKPSQGSKFDTGEVVVSFQVEKKGQLSSFKIEQSLGIREDAEAIRLIKEGPAWKLTRGKKARATVIVRF